MPAGKGSYASSLCTDIMRAKNISEGRLLTVGVLRYADNLERLHPGETLLQLLHEDSERSLTTGPLAFPRSEGSEEQFLTSSQWNWKGEYIECED